MHDLTSKWYEISEKMHDLSLKLGEISVKWKDLGSNLPEIWKKTVLLRPGLGGIPQKKAVFEQ